MDWPRNPDSKKAEVLSLGELLFPKLELKLVIARSSDTDVKATKGKASVEYIESAARIQLNKDDIKRLSLKDTNTVSVQNSTGKIIVKAVIDESVNSGIGVMPYGPWALALVKIPSDTPEIQLQGISVELAKSEEEVTSLDGLLDSP